jgi:diguanylate cyclase (GGDEF)-like protein
VRRRKIADQCRQDDELAIRAGEPLTLIRTEHNAKGEGCVFKVSRFTYHDADGALLLATVGIDITAQYEHEAVLAATRQMLEKLARNEDVSPLITAPRAATYRSAAAEPALPQPESPDTGILPAAQEALVEQRARWRAQIEQALASPPRWAGFTPALEARFARDTIETERRSWCFFAILGGLLYGAFIFVDHAILYDVFAIAVILRATILMGALLVSLIVWRTNWPLRAYEALFAFTTIAALAGIDLLGCISTTPYRMVYSNGGLVVVVYGLLCMNARRWATSITAFVCALIAILYALNSDLAPAQQLSMLTCMASLITLCLLTAYRLEDRRRTQFLLIEQETWRREELAFSNTWLRTMSFTDGLTGVLNRRAVNDILDKRLAESARSATHLGIILMDVDDFKAYNDHYGHVQGDNCLRRIAALLRAGVRDGDLVGRFGGEEFIVILPGHDLDDCTQLAERLRAAIEMAAMEHQAARRAAKLVTCSFGVAQASHDQPESATRLLQRADAALYAAKSQGRNRVVAAPVTS